MSLKGRDLLTLLDFSPKEIHTILDCAAELKYRKKAGYSHKIHDGKNIAIIFEKSSTRTRCAFEVAARDLGIGTTYLSSGSQIGIKESLPDTARVLSRMFDAIEYRGFEQARVESIAKYADVPVFNGLTNEFHPTQVLADLLTIMEHFKRLKGINLVYFGDARYNMGNSLMVGCAKMGMNYTACAPIAYFPSKILINRCADIASTTGATLSFETDPVKAASGADIIYTDIWASMGETEEVWNSRVRDLLPYQVNKEIMDIAGKNCKFMHCLPSYHNKDTQIGKKVCDRFGLDSLEVTDDVFEGSQSIVFDEAENRMHTIKAVMALMM